jgi:hypothetical protein
VGASLVNAGFTVLPTSAEDRLRYGYWYPDPNDPNKSVCDAPLDMPNTIIGDGNNIGDINSGMGFANYIGHGNALAWHCLHFGTTELAELTNVDMLPVGFAAACNTSEFAYTPNGLSVPSLWRDTTGQGHCGRVEDPNDPNLYTYPFVNLPKPAAIQDGTVQCYGSAMDLDRPCFGEAFLFGGDPPSPTGAIAYLGECANGQATSPELDQFFFEAYELGRRSLGDMWKYMIETYYNYRGLADSHNWYLDPGQWGWGHVFTEPEKFFVFGDPSLMVGGAFTRNRGGPCWDWDPLLSGPWFSYMRYRIVSDIVVPYGEVLSAEANASVLFEDERMLSAASGSYGFHAYGSADAPVYLLSVGTGSEPENVVNKFEVRGTFSLLDGGQLKMY